MLRDALLLLAVVFTACAPTGPCFAPRSANTSVRPRDGEVVDRVWRVPGAVQDGTWRGVFLLLAEPAAAGRSDVSYSVLTRGVSEDEDDARLLASDMSSAVTLTCAPERETGARGAWELELPDADTTGETVYQLHFGYAEAVLLRQASARGIDPSGTLEFIPELADGEP